MQIDFTPLIPVVNTLIISVAGLVSAAIPVLIGYGILWLRKHSINVDANTQATLVGRINATIDNGLRYATTAADDGVRKLNIQIDDPKIAKAVNYVIAQSPQVLKAAGIDPATTDGQMALTRLVTAKSVPSPVPPAVDVHLDGDTASAGVTAAATNAAK